MNDDVDPDLQRYIEIKNSAARLAGNRMYEVILSAIENSYLLEGYSDDSQKGLAFEIHSAIRKSRKARAHK
jgi:hypothetical protein